MKPQHTRPPTGPRVLPACATARGRAETLMRGRDATTRFGPTPTTRATMGDAARAAARRA